jgi:outer membrane protein assembly factor BamB
MNDQEWIALVNDKPPEELTLEEIESLRQRLRESDELRAALLERVEMEQYLAAALARVELPIDAIISRAQGQRRVFSSMLHTLFGVTACVFLIGLIGYAFVSALYTPEEDEGPIVAVKGDGEDDPRPNNVPDGGGAVDKGPMPPGEGGTGDPAGATAQGPASGPQQIERFPLLVQAEAFARGNVAVTATRFGDETADVLTSGSDRPSFVEYDLLSHRDGNFAIRLRYASFDSRPLRLLVNGEVVAEQVAGEQTGGLMPDRQQWFDVATVALKKGNNVVRLETAGAFPHLDQLAVDQPAAGARVAATGGNPGSGSPPAVAAGPWDEVVQAQVIPPAFQDVCFQTFDTSRKLTSQEELAKWFEPVLGHPGRVYTTDTRLGRSGAFDGLVRLKSPWRDDLALRLAVENYDRLQIHFFRGNAGLSLVYHEGRNYRWCAYAATREAGKPRPAAYALAAADDDRNRRSEIRFGGPFEIRYRAGEVVLSRGDVVILAAPLDGPPEEVYFDGRAVLQGIALVRSRDGPPKEAQRPVAADIERPAGLAWTSPRVEGARVQKLPDGTVELIADNAKEPAWIAAPLPRAGWHEAVFRVDEAEPGSGVYLGRGDGRPYEIARFVRDRKSGRVGLQWQWHDDEVHETEYPGVAEQPAPLVSTPAYVRLLYGCGVTRCWIGADGEHWAEAIVPQRDVPGGITHVGLSFVRGRAGKIRLGRLTLRELAALSSLADDELRAKAPNLSDLEHPGAWQVAMLAPQPAGTELAAWRRACAVRSLAAGCKEELGTWLVQSLLDDARQRDLPAEQQLALVDEASLVLHTRDNSSRLEDMVRRYHEVGLAAYRQQGARPFSFVRRPLMMSPLASSAPFRVTSPALVRLELIQLLYQGRWEDTLAFCDRLRFFQQQSDARLVEWAETVAARELPARAGSITLQRTDWLHPLIEELSKEAYNVLVEMHSALDGEAFADACRIIMAVNPHATAGLTPSPHDKQLLVSLPAAISGSMVNYPELRAAMRDQFGPLARLRVRQGIAEGNLSALHMATVQFGGTEAAAEAYRWLGDRALSGGQFALALAHYRRAEHSAPASMLADLSARARLAAAMIGRDLGQPVTQPVQLGDITLAAAEFESLVGEMRGRHAASGDGAGPVSSFGGFAPAPTGYETRFASKFEGAVGDKPEEILHRHVRQLGVPWVDRQLGVAVDESAMYVGNRFQVAAYSLHGGQQLWNNAQAPGRTARSHDWTLVPMRPVVAGKRLFVRQLNSVGPVLACMDKKDGSRLWISEQRSGEHVVSDPLVFQDELFALTMKDGEQNERHLRLTNYDAQTGQPLSHRPLFRVRDSWRERRVCEVSATEDAIVASMGGIVFACDLSGQVRWIRRQVVLPAEEEPTWVLQWHQPPLVDGERMYVAQPGVRAVECLDPESGRMLWSGVLPGIRRIVGLAQDTLIAETDDGFTGLDAATGAEVWSRAEANILTAATAGGPGGILYARKANVPGNSDKCCPELVWLDPKTGAVTALTRLPLLEHADPQFGPVVPRGDRLYALFGRGTSDARRDVIEMTAKGKTREPAAADASDSWQRYLPARLLSASQSLFPEWAVLSGHGESVSFLRDEEFGEKNVLAVESRSGMPVAFARRVDVPDDGKLRLRVKTGSEPSQAWKLEVRFAGTTLATKEFDEKNSPQPWREFEVDLAPVRGQAGWLVVVGQYKHGGDRTRTLWKRLEVAP